MALYAQSEGIPQYIISMEEVQAQLIHANLLTEKVMVAIANCIMLVAKDC